MAKNKIGEINKHLNKIEKEVILIKETLKKHTIISKDFDQERIFIINRVTRLEKEIELIKKQLKVA